ncbi:hypothetical protein Pelo_7523 [Pelomyxa schiedti]|nr:hypothetical protein Pelo_7523 [Pelomyxa schiedti]
MATSTRMEDRHWQYMRKIKVVYVATATAEGPNVRAMEALSINDKIPDGSIRFFTSKDSKKVAEMHQSPKACLYMWSREGMDCHQASEMRVMATCSFETDRAIKEKLWNDSLYQYFPGGVEDPTLLVLKVTPVTVEYKEGRH